MRTLTNSACALALAALSFSSSACAVAPRAAPGKSGAADAASAQAPARPLDFDEYMRADFAPADGFDFPFGDGEGGGSYTDAATGRRYDGWYVATHFAEAYSLGQGVGEKQVEGDNRTPKGMYFVVQKHRSEFPGAYGAYYGGHWIKINYPNKYDAARGRAAHLLTPAQESSIAAAWERRAPTLETTRLGGGIGFHGWAREWEDTGPRHLSWGCVVLHLSDIRDFYDRLPEGSMVIIF